MEQELSLVAIDLAKKIFHLVGADTTGNVLGAMRWPRHTVYGHEQCTVRLSSHAPYASSCARAPSVSGSQ